MAADNAAVEQIHSELEGSGPPLAGFTIIPADEAL